MKTLLLLALVSSTAFAQSSPFSSSGISLAGTNSWSAAQSFLAPVTTFRGSLLGQASNGLAWLYTNNVAGDIVLNNQTSTSPGINFYWGNNLNYGIDTDGANLRFVKNRFEAGGVIMAKIDTNGQATFGMVYNDTPYITGGNSNATYFSSIGTDTNIDVWLVPKGTGKVQMGATGTAPVASGAITVTGVAAGAVGVQLSTGVKLKLGAGTLDYLYSNGSNTIFDDGTLVIGQTIYSPLFSAPGGSTNQLYGAVADGASAVAVLVSSNQAFANAGSKLFSIQNNLVEKAFFGPNGGLTITGVAANGVSIQMSNSTKLHLGTGTNDFLYSDGVSTIITPGFLASSGVKADFVAPNSRSIYTCVSAAEGQIIWDNTSGVATGNPTRLCMCSSNGASVYTWRNVISGTTGTATTCAN